MKIIFFVFAGRRANLEIQRPYLDRLLDQHADAELHLWDLTRTPEDGEYVRAQSSTRVRVLTHLHPGHPIACRASAGSRRGCTCLIHRPPYEQPYAWYAERDEYADAVFVKLDDDVLFIETERFGDLLDAVAENPRAVVSANVINNVVCAKHDPLMRVLVEERLNPGNPHDPANDRAWWYLHTDPDFARLSHAWFLDNREALTAGGPNLTRSRPGEKISINTIALTHATLKRLVGMIEREPKLGDEGAVDRMLPHIAQGFRVAHLTFGPQDKAMTLAELDELRARYALLAKEYLGASPRLGGWQSV